MGSIAPFLITPSTPDLTNDFMLAIQFTPERWDMFISALSTGGEVVYSADEILHLCDVLQALSAVYPPDAFIGAKPMVFSFGSEDFEIIEGTPTRVINPSFPFNGGRVMTTQNASIVFYVDVSGGSTLNVKVLTIKGSNSGIVTAYWNGNLVATLDGFSSTTIPAHEWNFSVSNIEAGLNALTFSCFNKNASSTGYAMSILHVHGRVTP